MAWTRRSDAELADRREGQTPSVATSEPIAWIDHDAAEQASSHSTPTTRSNLIRLALGLCAFGLVASLLASAFGRTEERAADPIGEVDPGPTTAPVVAPPTTSIPEAALLDQLPSTADEIVDDQVLVWIDGDGMLRARRLLDGAELELSVLAENNLPPLPEHIHLLGATNGTWLLDLLEPERSGKLSNTVRMVRFGDRLDSYGFSSVDESGTTEFFVGSLWGPAMNGLAEVDASTAVFFVPRAGIISSGRDATSQVLRGSGFEPMPSRLGRIVAASRGLVAGIHCDDLGRCVGRVSSWDGAGEVQVDATTLSAPVVRISPDERFIIATGGSTLSLIDLESGSQRQWSIGLDIDDSLVWSTDSSTAFAIVDDAVVALQVTTRELSLSQVRSSGAIDSRLEGADVAVFVDPTSG